MYIAFVILTAFVRVHFSSFNEDIIESSDKAVGEKILQISTCFILLEK